MEMPSRLLARFPLYSSESWEGILRRLSHLNYGDECSILYSVARERLKAVRPQGDLFRPRLIEEYRVLSELTGIYPEDIYASSLHSFARLLSLFSDEVGYLLLNGEKKPLLTKSYAVLRQHFDWIDCKYCRQCIRENAFHANVWYWFPVTACVRHRCLLATACPSCHKAVGVREIVDTHCSACGGSLLDGDFTDLSRDQFGVEAQSVIQSWVDPLSHPLEVNYGHLIELPDHVLYAVLFGLCSSLDHLLLDTTVVDEYSILALHQMRKEGLPILHIHVAVTMVFRALLDWPNKLHEIFKIFIALRRGAYNPNTIISWLQGDSDFQIDENLAKSPSTAGAHGELGTLYSKWLEGFWKRSEFQLLQQAFDDFYVENYAFLPGTKKSQRSVQSKLSSQTSLITLNEASQILGISLQSARRLTEVKLLPSQRVAHSNCEYVARQGIYDFAAQLQQALTLEDTSHFLGMTGETVLNLCKYGAIRALRGPTVDGGLRWLFERNSVERFYAQFSVIEACNPTQKVVSLTRAAQIVAIVGLNASSLVHLVSKKEIKAYWSNPTGPDANRTLSSMVFLETDLRSLLKTEKQRNNWITLHELARRMGVKDLVASRWVKGHLITPVAIHCSALYFDKEQTEVFASEHLFSQDAATFLGVHKLTIQRWARNGTVRVVSGPGIDNNHRYLFRVSDLAAFK